MHRWEGEAPVVRSATHCMTPSHCISLRIHVRFNAFKFMGACIKTGSPLGEESTRGKPNKASKLTRKLKRARKVWHGQFV